MRHVPWGRLRKDENDAVIGFLGQAFERRFDENYLSVSWVEYYAEPTTRIRDAVWGVRRARKVGPKSAFAVANVAKVKETCLTTSNVRVRIVPEPLENWPAHAGIRQIPRDDMGLLEALATEAFTEMVLNQTVPPEPAE
jgi:hypothetical protein